MIATWTIRPRMADIRGVRRRYPFRVRLPDAGWLYIISGLIVGAASVLIPAQEQLRHLETQRDELATREQHLAKRLHAHAVLLEDLDRAHPAMVRRLAAAQLNVMPRQWEPILLARETTAQVDRWVETAVPMTVARTQAADEQSLLSKLVQGPHRLWVMGAAVLCMFAGLVIGSAGEAESAVRPRKQLDHAAKRRAAARRSRARAKSMSAVFGGPETHSVPPITERATTSGAEARFDQTLFDQTAPPSCEDPASAAGEACESEDARRLSAA